MDEAYLEYLKTRLKEKEQPKNNHLNLINVLLIVIIGSLIFISGILGYTSSFIIGRFSALEILFSILPTSTPLANETNILILGSDATPGIKRSDAIMVVHVNPQKNEVDVISIPRDTLVLIPGIGMDKINHAFAYGGAELSLRTVSNFLGVDIPYYISIGCDGITKVIDQIGGVPVNVAKRLYYVDYAGGLFVDLNPGFQRLSGKQSMGYLRFRHDSEGDYGRIERQHKFIQSLGSEIVTQKDIFRTPSVIQELLSYVQTNLKTEEILNIASALRSAYDGKHVNMYSLFGSGTMIDNVYYMKPNEEFVHNVVAKVFTSGNGKNKKFYN